MALPPKRPPVPSLEEKLRDGYVPEPFSGCWLWMGVVTKDGYGQLVPLMREGPRTSIKAHRLSYELHKGRIPPGLKVLHSCDTPCCVNPAHLRVGTDKDNKLDAIRKNRHARGETNGHSKLTTQQVLDIRAAHSSGRFNQSAAARHYGINSSVVCEIVHRKVWKHI